jgi:hypothetical protein
VADLDYSPFRVRYREHAGDSRPVPPAQEDFWAASAQGAGTQSMTWKVRDGSWSVVVMNADGSRGVDAGVSAGPLCPSFARWAGACSAAGSCCWPAPARS